VTLVTGGNQLVAGGGRAVTARHNLVKVPTSEDGQRNGRLSLRDQPLQSPWSDEGCDERDVARCLRHQPAQRGADVIGNPPEARAGTELDVGSDVGDGNLFRLLLRHAFGDEFLLALVLGQFLALVALALVAVPSRRSEVPTPLPLGCCCRSAQLVHRPYRGRNLQTDEVCQPCWQQPTWSSRLKSLKVRSTDDAGHQ